MKYSEAIDCLISGRAVVDTRNPHKSYKLRDGKILDETDREIDFPLDLTGEDNWRVKLRLAKMITIADAFRYLSDNVFGYVKCASRNQIYTLNGSMKLVTACTRIPVNLQTPITFQEQTWFICDRNGIALEYED